MHYSQWFALAENFGRSVLGFEFAGHTLVFIGKIEQRIPIFRAFGRQRDAPRLSGVMTIPLGQF